MYKTAKPFGFINKDVIWVYQNFSNSIVVLPTDLSIVDYYRSVSNKKHTVFLIEGVTSFKYLMDNYDKDILKGRFVLLDTEESLQRAHAIILDKDDMIVDCQAFIKASLPYIKYKEIKKSFFENESVVFIKTIKNRIMNQKKVFKKTFQTLMSDLHNLAKKKLTPQCYSKNKNYLSELLVRVVTNNLPYSELRQIKFGDYILKNGDGYNDVIKYCGMPSAIRTIQCFQDVILNKVDVQKSLYENYGDAFSLNIMLEAWHPKTPVTFPCNYTKEYNALKPISKDCIISKKLVKRRNKRDFIVNQVSPIYKVKKCKIKVETLIKKLKLPEDDYRVIGTNVNENGNVNLEKKPFALHGIRTNKVFSIQGVGK